MSSSATSIKDRHQSMEDVISSRDIATLVSLVMFVVSNAFAVTDIVITDRFRRHNDVDWYALHPHTLQDNWKRHLLHRDVRLAAGVFNALGWCAFLIPIVKTATVLSKNWKRRSGTHLWMILLAFGAFFTETMCRLMMLGMENIVDWVSRNFNLDNWGVYENGKPDEIGWRVVEILATINRGIVLWVEVFEWLAMGCIMSVIFFSLATEVETAFPTRFRVLSGVVAIVSFFTFALNVFKLDDHGIYAAMQLAYITINVFVLYPLWFSMLSKRLPIALEDMRTREREAEETGVEVVVRDR